MTEQLNLTRVPSIESTIAEAKGDAPVDKLIDNTETANTRVSDRGEPPVSDTDVSNAGIAGAPVPTWRDTLPDELKNTPSLAKFKDVESLAKSYLEGEKAFSGRIAIPREDAPDADWDAFYKKIGRPEDKRYRPDGLTIGEDEEPILARYEEILHASGLTRKQGQKVLNHMVGLSASMEDEARARMEAARVENLKTLEKAFGGQMDLKVNQIQAALGKFGSQGLAALVEQTNYHPGLVQFLSAVGEKLASDRLVTGDAPSPLPGSRQAALAEIKRLETDEDFQVNYRYCDGLQ